jgi:hypothetical protein
MAAAMLAVPAVASASVNVDDGMVGTVGKGVVQNALGLANDQAIQTLFKSDGGSGIKFTNKFVATTTTTWDCVQGDGTRSTQTHYRNTIITSAVNATANTNGAGKLTNGWNLTGKGSTLSIGEDNTGGTRFPSYTCPAGTGTRDFASINVAQSHASGLYVNGVALPNTPVEVAPVA